MAQSYNKRDAIEECATHSSSDSPSVFRVDARVLWFRYRQQIKADESTLNVSNAKLLMNSRYRINKPERAVSKKQWGLVRTGVQSELMAALFSFAMGAMVAPLFLILADVLPIEFEETYAWPTNEMTGRGTCANSQCNFTLFCRV